ncbi:MAG: diaminopimelate epimerase [Bacillota bacterium]
MLEFTKMSGCGNDFIIIDNRNGVFTSHTLSSWAKALCRRRISLGADGLLVIEASRSRSHMFMMRLFNPDGSEGEMCGNGARCAARWAYENIRPASREFEFNTLAGPVRALVREDGLVRLEMPRPSEIVRRKLIVGDGEREVYFLRVGVPHTVVLMNGAWEASDEYIRETGRRIRYDAQFADGTNVNFVDSGPHEIRVRTYERGVEEETLACGTGATASAVVCRGLGLVDPTVKVRTKGGVLVVDLAADRPYLTADARFIAAGTVCKDALSAT